MGGPRRRTFDEIFTSRIEKKSNGCWNWIGPHDSYGYGQTVISKKIIPAHRYSYEHFIGIIPKGLEIDHLCRNHSCVNPSHLEAVTHQKNMERGIWATRTHCPNGHLYAENNKKIDNNGNSKGCLWCERERHKSIQYKHKRYMRRTGIKLSLEEYIKTKSKTPVGLAAPFFGGPDGR